MNIPADDKFHAVIAECKRIGLFSDTPEGTSGKVPVGIFKQRSRLAMG